MQPCLGRAEVWWCQATGAGARCKEEGIGAFWFGGTGIQVGKQHKRNKYECESKDLQTGQSIGGGFVHVVFDNDDLRGCRSYFDGGV